MELETLQHHNTSSVVRVSGVFAKRLSARLVLTKYSKNTLQGHAAA
jgi:hypothetical protein